jgi:hypothetical protein
MALRPSFKRMVERARDLEERAVERSSVSDIWFCGAKVPIRRRVCGA